MGKRNTKRHGRLVRAAAVFATAIGATNAVMNSGNVQAETVNAKAAAQINTVRVADMDPSLAKTSFTYASWFDVYYNNKRVDGLGA
ncbi:hypothetical protein, partial [Alicyclobacillus acidocaldarius]|uniref:hypothetical protein n=1 Tax=Alicyclobacillus acidocaldarius TaxID=405212 RepID=UPI00345E6E52